jgi:hypothetical protein
MSLSDRFEGRGLRAGEGFPGAGSLFSTDKAVAVLVLGALALLTVARVGFRGALGD